MVHTRHSYNKDTDEVTEDYHELNGHDDQIDGAIMDHHDEETRDNDINITDQQHDTGLNIPNIDDDGNKKTNKNDRISKRLRRSDIGLYEYADHRETLTRRSLRNLAHERKMRTKITSCPHKNYDMDENHCGHCSKEHRGKKERSDWLKCSVCDQWFHEACFSKDSRYPSIPRRPRHQDARRFKSYGCSLIRKSDRQPKKIYETFNVVEMQRTNERNHREMLELEQSSMYDGIKRRRGDLSDDDEDTQEGEDSDEEEEEEETEEEEDEEEESCGYSLRKTKPKTKIYQAPPLHGSRRKVMYSVPESPIHMHKHMRIPQHASSPSHGGYKRRRTSSTSSSDEEAAFERRRKKSMHKSRSRCLPMNFKPSDMVGVLKSREMAHSAMPIGSSLADVDPMMIDTKITFSEIGGLDHHVRALKEMVIFPLLYTEVFQKFNITPPRGVLFHGPPGTGKTLVARALANECSTDGKKVAFFMRKGADCLSKWVGESERQLRLLFEQAYSMRPSIIFFDEIDGIAPIRSTRQDQIHSSIVSTLLALMDGLDARGEIVVIGATNRLDAIDSALRRPGRFDREFLFSLPNKKGREKIFEIHTASWQPKLSHDFIVELADKCVGYCGADIKALCTETALFALRRRYPQIYESKKKLVLDTNEIKVSSVDFKNAMGKITPASHRSTQSPGLALPEAVRPLLGNIVKKCLDILHGTFPSGKEIKDDLLSTENLQLEEDDGRNIFERGRSRQRYSSSRDSTNNSYFSSGKQSVGNNVTHRPRFLLHGKRGNGQTSYIAPALMYAMEHLTTHGLDLPSLYVNSSRSPEETVAQVFREARRTTPCIIYLPHIGVWWQSVAETTRFTFMTLLQDLPAGVPILFLATAEGLYSELPEEIQDLYSTISNERIQVLCPASSERHAYFKDLMLHHALQTPDMEAEKVAARLEKEVLIEATPTKPRELTTKESKALLQSEESVLRELRLFLREITWKLLADRKNKEFSKPVDLQEVDDYLEVIQEPMDLSTVMTRINSHYYHSCAHFLLDIDLIMNNCLEYNPDRDQLDKLLRNRACEMRDVAHALVYNVLDPDFEKMCIEIHEARVARGYDEKANAPNFLKVLPRAPKSTSTATTNTSLINNSMQNGDLTTSGPKPLPNIPDPTGSRYSRRVRGLSESNKTENDLDHVLSRKRNKLTANDSSVCEASFENSLDCLNASDQEEPIIGEEILFAHQNGIGNDICSKKMGELKGVKRNLEFENPCDTNKGLTDLEEAEILLTKLVENTYNNSVETLGRIYTSVCRTLTKHRKSENRGVVLEDLKEIIEKLA